MRIACTWTRAHTHVQLGHPISLLLSLCAPFLAQLDHDGSGTISYLELFSTLKERRGDYSTDCKRLLTALSFDVYRNNADDADEVALAIKLQKEQASVSASYQHRAHPQTLALTLTPSPSNPRPHPHALTPTPSPSPSRPHRHSPSRPHPHSPSPHTPHLHPLLAALYSRRGRTRGVEHPND